MDGENRPDGGRSGKHREVDYRHLDGDSSQPSDPFLPLRERYVDENRACSPAVEGATTVISNKMIDEPKIITVFIEDKPLFPTVLRIERGNRRARYYLEWVEDIIQSSASEANE